MSARAALMFVGICANFLLRAKPHIFPFAAKTSIVSDAASDDLDDDSCADTTELAMAMTAWQQTQQRKTAAGSPALTESAPVGGDIAPARSVFDAYASLHSVAIDADANRVFMSDSNRGAIFLYDRTAGDNSSQMVSPERVIRGPGTGMMFVAGISLDPIAGDRPPPYSSARRRQRRLAACGSKKRPGPVRHRKHAVGFDVAFAVLREDLPSVSIPNRGRFSSR
jgi:hypothetical protein